MTALFLIAAALTAEKLLALVFLSLAYGAITFAQPGNMAVCLDVGGKFGGAMTGALNTAAYLSAFLSSVIFGYLVKIYGNYNAPFVPMIALLGIGVLLTLRLDASREIIPGSRNTSENTATVAT